MNVYYVADALTVIGRASVVPDGASARPIAEADVPVLAELYRSAYGSAMSLDDAVAEMTSAFDGSWGALWLDASPAALVGGRVVAVVQTVRRPSWDDTQTCPWIIEVFTDPAHRRNGLARALVGVACQVVHAGGEERIGLTVDDAKASAVALYRSLGFWAAN